MISRRRSILGGGIVFAIGLLAVVFALLRYDVNPQLVTSESLLTCDNITANRYVYANDRYGFSVTYPNNFYIKEFGRTGKILLTVGFYPDPVITEEYIGPIVVEIVRGDLEEQIDSLEAQLLDVMIGTDGSFWRVIGLRPALPGSLETLTIEYLLLNHSGIVYRLSLRNQAFQDVFQQMTSSFCLDSR